MIPTYDGEIMHEKKQNIKRVGYKKRENFSRCAENRPVTRNTVLDSEIGIKQVIRHWLINVPSVGQFSVRLMVVTAIW